MIDYSMDLYEISSELAEVRDNLILDLKDSGEFSEATDEELGYFAKLITGVMAAFPGLPKEEARARADALHGLEVEAENPLAISFDESVLKPYLGTYNMATGIKANVGKALRDNHGIKDVSASRKLAKRIEVMLERKKGQADGEPGAATEGVKPATSSSEKEATSPTPVSEGLSDPFDMDDEADAA